MERGAPGSELLRSWVFGRDELDDMAEGLSTMAMELKPGCKNVIGPISAHSLNPGENSPFGISHAFSAPTFTPSPCTMAAWWRPASLRHVAAAAHFRLIHRNHYHSFIQAIPREVSGSRVSARDRAQGRIPAVVFYQSLLEKDAVGLRQSSRKYLLTTEKKQIKSVLNSVQLPFFCSTTFGLQIRAGSGSSTLLEFGRVLPIKIHRDEETGKILNLVFVWADEGTQLKVDVPVVFTGEDACSGLRKGGYLNRIRTSLRYICPAEHIPSKIEVNVSNLDIGDKIYIQDVEVHPSLKLLSKGGSIPICKVGAHQPKIEGPIEV